MLNDVLAVNPISRFLTSMIFMSANNGLSRLYYPDSAFLKTINDTGETGYPTDKKVEIKTIESLLKHKLVKKGAKDKASGKTHYHVSSAGKKHLESTTTPSTGS